MENCYLLPEDLMIEILSWLPVASLFRFRCVCKSWLSLFARSFVNKHHSDIHRRLLVACSWGDRAQSILSLSYDTLDVLHEPSGFLIPPKQYRMLGSFNGLVCLADVTYRGSEDIMFWNPATRQTKLVHKSNIPGPCYDQECATDHGFGYDFKTNDFKVVKIITSLYCWPSGARSRVQRTELYSLSTDSWKKIYNVIPKGFLADNYYHMQTSINGIYSRLVRNCYNGNDGSYCLLTFDMSDELSHISPPVPNANEDMALTPLNDSVAYICCKNGRSERCKTFEVYVLTEYGPNGTWNKLYTIGPLSNNIRSSLLFWKNDEFFFDNIYGELVLCDGKTRSKRCILKIRGANNLQILEYRESLVEVTS